MINKILLLSKKNRQPLVVKPYIYTSFFGIDSLMYRP